MDIKVKECDGKFPLKLGVYFLLGSTAQSEILNYGGQDFIGVS